MEKYKKRAWLLLGVLLIAGLLYLQSVYTAKELADRRLQESFENIRLTQTSVSETAFPFGHQANSQAELPYIKEMRYNQQSELVYEEQELIDHRYAELRAKKKDGLKLDLVVFRYLTSETELAPIFQVSLSEFYYR